mmetsp:Transcript_5292/g.9715  ORF Transcript_5292/g.9715 Transcript_5292/m.9715 type:complete len:519 (+) Transcript_5292:82-1638(+)
MKTLTWNSYDASSVLAPRDGHSLVYSPRLRRWLVYGGVEAKPTSEVYALNPVNSKCNVIETQGAKPNERSYHSTWVDHTGAWMFIFGGKGLSGEMLSDFFALELTRVHWKKVTFVSQPPPRIHQAYCAIQGMLVISGGESTHLLNDFWSLPYSEIDWAGLQTHAAGWQQHRLRGHPSARKGHSFSTYRDTIVSFGGVTSEGATSDLFILNLSDMKWSEGRARGASPCPRAFHSSTVMTHTYLAVFGGLDSRNKPLKDFYLLDLNEMVWSIPVTSGASPSARYLHGLCWGLSEDGRGILLVLGGSSRTFCEMQVYTLEEQQRMQEVPTLSHEVRAVSSPSLESTVTQQRARIAALENEKALLALELDKERQRSNDVSSKLAVQIQTLEQSQNTWRDRFEQLTTIVSLKKKKEDLMQGRVEDLEDLVKKAEILLITLDHTFNEIVSQKKVSSSIAKETLEMIEERKKLHKESLMHMKSLYQATTEEIAELDRKIEGLESSRPKSSIELSPSRINDSLEDI